MDMHPKILIVMTTPYSTSDSSRTLDTYFHFWERDRVRQIFTRNWIPSRGHCGEMFQITDASLLKKWFHSPCKVGKIYTYAEMRNEDGNKVMEDNSAVKLGYAIGSKHSPSVEILRGLLWRKKLWCTSELVEWMDKYKPECVVYNFSNHLFTQQIALFAASRYNIPIVTVIGDDYYFNDMASFSPAYWMFRYRFKKLTKKILLSGKNAIYCSDKIRDKYNSCFGIKGETIYITSSITRREFRPINKENPKFVYFGSIRLGRNKALCNIATELGKINPKYKLEVYSNENDSSVVECLRRNANALYGGSIPYSEVEKKIKEADVFVIAEGFENKDINFTRYSLSTKAADALACGVSILTYGPEESGVVEYMEQTEASMVCTDPSELRLKIENLLMDVQMQKRFYDNATLVFARNHTLKSTAAVFEKIVLRAIKEGKDI